MASGMIRQRRGKPYIVLYLPNGQGGKTEKWLSVEKELGPGAGNRAINKLLRDKLQELERRRSIIDTNKIISMFLREWLEIKKTTIQQSTYESYESTVRLHILPYLAIFRPL